MRRISALWLSLAACSGTELPSPPAPEVVASPSAELASPPEQASDLQASKPRSDAHDLVGKRSPDLLLEPPEGLRPRGERIIASARGWGLVAGEGARGQQLIALDRRLEDEGVFEIEAVLVLPAEVPKGRISWDGCRLGGVPDDRVVAVVAREDACAWEAAVVDTAWRVDPEERAFQPIDPRQVRCLAPFCPDEMDQGVPFQRHEGSAP